MSDAKDVLLTAGDIGLPLLHRGKVREVFDLGDKLVFVATDRISAFDVVFAEGVPGKGQVLTELSALWFAASEAIVPNHFVTMNGDEMAAMVGGSGGKASDRRLAPDMQRRLAGRTMIGVKTERIDVECVVRGYLAGSGWAEYERSGTVCGIPLPLGLRLNERLPEPIFTPALKVDDGHDVNVPFAEVVARYGSDLAEQLRELSLRLYEFGAERAAAAGLILADTKFEFGLHDGRLIVIDELLTPDSSRFWPRDRYVVGQSIDSLDKQPVRDYLETTGWDKQPPAPPLTPEVIAASAARYEDVLERLRAVLTDAPADAIIAPQATDPPGVHPVWRDVNLSAWEYERIVELLGRPPNALELELFGVMWSEHCSYKNSRALLQRLPTTGERIVQGPGENAGAIRVGERTIVFKIESHNSPSAVVPFDGAATGVGGILRDIFTMGAQPVAVLDSLRFGPADEERQQQLFDGATAGIAAYARGVGVPNVGSEVRWDASYARNPLVNAMAVGVAQGPLAQGVAAGPGNNVLVFGRATGRDGVRSASFSSRELPGDGTEIPLIPAGDPAAGKRLLDATLALLATGAIVGIQDMGAAGFTSSACEMAAKAGTGIEIDVAHVPKVDDTIEPFEVMLSETQERMLAVVEAGKEDAVRSVLDELGVDYAFCGVVTDDGVVRVRNGADVLAEVPARYLADEAPCYVRPVVAPPDRHAADDSAVATATPERKEDAASLAQGDDPADENGTAHWNAALLDVLSSPNVGSLRPLRSRYGAEEPGIPRAGIIDLGAGPESALAVATYGNGRYVAADPYIGAQLCVAAAARRVVAAGAEPVAITNGLNFGNPENPTVYWQMERTITGMAEACKALGTPVTGGNVSLFNETDGAPIHPTPIVGMVGVLPDAASALPQGFRHVGNAVILIGTTTVGLGGSEYGAAGRQGAPALSLPPVDLDRERQLYDLMGKLAATGLVAAAHSVDDGGLAVALAHMSFAAESGAKGCHITLEEHVDVETALFGESPGRIVLEAPIYGANEIVGAATAAGIPCMIIGRVADGSLHFVDGKGDTVIDMPTAEAAVRWEEAIPYPWLQKH